MSPSAMATNGHTKPVPLDMSHHYSRATKKRIPNVMKEYYKFLCIPDMGSLAGGSPFPGTFPFNSVDISVVGSDKFLSSNGMAKDDASHDISINRFSQATNAVRTIDLNTCMQYGGNQGYAPLYAWLRKLATIYHPNVPYKDGADIMITGGCADALSKVYEVLFNHWDVDHNPLKDREGLLVEEFIYPPPVSQIRPRDVNIVPIKMDSEGMLAYGDGGLHDVLHNWDPAQGKRPHAVYLIPTGQNPTSGVLSFVRRTELYEVCSKFDVIIIEDDPYWNLYYPSSQSESLKYRSSVASPNFPTDQNHNYSTESLNGRSTGFQFLDQLVPSFISIDTDGRVIRMDTFSKTVAPGCRLGWITAQPNICEQLFRVTDGTTQQPAGLMQAIVTELIADFSSPSSKTSTTMSTSVPVPNGHSSPKQSPHTQGWGIDGWVNWLEGLRNTYQRRMITMATIFEKGRFLTPPTTSLPSIATTTQTEMYTFSWPIGGMFIWLQVNIQNHPLATSSHITHQRLMQALWILCTQPPHRLLTIPGIDFIANPSVQGTTHHGYRYLRFCFAAVEEKLLEDKAQAFINACRQFWQVKTVEDVEAIMGNDEDGFDRQPIGEW